MSRQNGGTTKGVNNVFYISKITSQGKNQTPHSPTGRDWTGPKCEWKQSNTSWHQ